MAQDLIAKNPCDFCKPPKRVKTPINALSREERTRMLRLAMQAEPQPLGFAVEIALTTGMRRGEVCALRWSDLSDDGTITVSHALGNGPGGFYVKEPKTGSSVRTIPLTKHLNTMHSARRRDAERVAREMGVSLGDPYILGTKEEKSRPYNPTQLGKDFAAFCKMDGFKCTFHGLRHTFATMMIANGCDVRTVASYLGHASVSMTLDIYADVDRRPSAQPWTRWRTRSTWTSTRSTTSRVRHGAKRWCWRTHVLGGSAQGNARRRRGEGGRPWASLDSSGASRAGSSAPCLGGCERA